MSNASKTNVLLSPSTTPFFSVILPTFNRKTLVLRAIDSVLFQNYQDFELIVVDDGSNDGTIEVLDRYKDPRLKILQKENGGVSSARNLGLENARGKYVTFVDSDDYLLQGFLEDAWEFFSQYQVSGVFYSGLTIEDRKTKEIPLFWEKKLLGLKCYDDYELFKDFCLLSGNSWACAKFFDRDLINSHRIRFCENITYGEDLNFILQFLFFVPNVGLKNQGFYCCDMRHESLNRGQIDMDTQAENLLRNHRKIKDMLFLHQRKDLLYCLNSLTVTHLAGRYFKRVKQYQSRPSSWGDEFLEICNHPEQELNFVRRVKKRCIMLNPAIFGVWAWSLFNKSLLLLEVVSKIRRKISKIIGRKISEVNSH